MSLNEAIDTTSAGGKLVFHIMGALAEFEREAVIEEPIGEAQHMIDRALAQPPLLDEVGFEVRQQRRPYGLRFGDRHRMRHADIDQLLGEPPGEIVEADCGVSCGRHRAREFIRKVGGQCLRRDPASSIRRPRTRAR